MKILRNAFLTSFLILVWSIVLSSAAIPSAFAQDDVSAPPPPPSAKISPEPTPDQPQIYDKPDAGQSEMAPEQQQDQSQVQPQIEPQVQPQGQPSDQRYDQRADQPAYDKPDAGRPMEIPDESPSATANEPSYANDMGNSQVDESDRNDPPGRVARLQYTTGSVSVQPHGTEQWVQGAVNRPLTIADNVWADKDSRAELNVGTGLIRIGSETSLTLTNVSDNSVQLSLHQGAMNLHVRHLYNGEVYEVDTPNQAFTILKTGDYRFDVDPNADTTLVTVWRGEGESTGQGPSVRIKEHQQARFTSGDTLAHEIHSAPHQDGFDAWCQVRNRREDDSISARYVSPDVIGSEDLDAYGTWRDTPEYGRVWVPTQVDSGWAPYTDGQWIYESPWGWTWVDSAPWGFAPFHYGRWVSFGGNWGWAPGPYYGGWGRGWYAPALASWFGGPGWGVGVGFGFGGGFGWCPLGWGEPFRPWYHAGWGYFRGVNVYNTRINNINNFHGFYRNGSLGVRGGFHYANLNARGGFTAVSRGTLERGLPVRQNAVRVNASMARSAPALGRPNVNPTMQSRMGSNTGRAAPARSNAFGSSRAGLNGQGASASRNLSNSGRSVPRPSQSFGRSSNSAGAISASSANNRGANGLISSGRTVPRPPAGGVASQRSFSNSRGSATSQQFAGRSGASSGGFRNSSRNNVPRPTGQVQPAPRSYSSGGNSPGYSSRSYSGNSGRYGSGSQYGGGSRYSGSPYSARTYSAPSYGGRSSYGGSSYGGGSRSAAPSGGGRSYGGSSYGGGRSYSSSRGSSGGGGGSRGSSGGGGSRGSSHGGRH